MKRIGIPLIIACVVAAGIAVLNLCSQDRVFELQSGKVIIGRITGEARYSYFITFSDGSKETTVLRRSVQTIRRPTTAELLKVKVVAIENMLQRLVATRGTSDRKRETAVQREERYKREVQAARKTMEERSGQPEPVSPEKLKQIQRIKEYKEKGMVLAGMTEGDVIEAIGRPNFTKRSLSERGVDEWHYRQEEGRGFRVISFRDGIVTREAYREK